MSTSDTTMDDDEQATRDAALAELYEHALPKDAPGAWIRDAIERKRQNNART